MHRVRLLAFAVSLVAATTALAQPTPDAAPVDPAPPDFAPVPDSVPEPVGEPEPEPEPEPVPAPAPPAKGAKLTREERDRIRKACEAEEPACDPIALLGSIERQTLERALAARGHVIDPAPWGKTVGKIHVFNEKVFSPKDGVLQFFNHFHVVTRERMIEREVRLRPGAVWKQSKIDETARDLRNPIFSTLAVIVPVRGATPETVDIFVVTRDVWSLRFNTQYSYQDSRLTYLTASISENNFLGLRKYLALTYEMDLSEAGIGPVYLDPNFLGKRLDVYARFYALFNRDDLIDERDFTYEGSSSYVRFNRPLWSLDEKWGGGIEFRHQYNIERRYVQDAGGRFMLRPYDNPDTPAEEAVPWTYQQRYIALSTGGQYGFGEGVEHRLKAGHQLASQRPIVTEDFVGSPELQAAFERDVLPRYEVTSALYAGYEVFVPRYRQFRNIGTFDLAEDVRLGPSAEVIASAGLKVIGSDANYLRVSASAGYTHPWGLDGLLRASGTISVRYQPSDPAPYQFIDNSAGVETRVITPTLFRTFRIANEIRLATLWHETNRFLSLGGDNGLRGFGINQFDGQRRLIMQTEVRSMPLPILFMRWGIVVFHDVGGAADTLKEIPLHHDLGLGVRILTPQLSSQVLRFDFAFPLDGPAVGQFRFSAGFMSAF